MYYKNEFHFKAHFYRIELHCKQALSVCLIQQKSARFHPPQLPLHCSLLRGLSFPFLPAMAARVGHPTSFNQPDLTFPLPQLQKPGQQNN